MANLTNRNLKVIHYVWFNNSHVNALIAALNTAGINAKKSESKFPKLVLQILLGPLMPVWYKLRGFQVIHIHWIAGQFRPARLKSPTSQQFFYILYRLFFKICTLLNLKVVWTAHNLVPHEPIFKDDLEARKFLIRNCDRVIALNQEIRDSLVELFSPNQISLIPAAEPGVDVTVGRQASRTRLGLLDNQLHFCALGHIRPYKGPDIFLKALIDTQSESHFSLVGSANDQVFKDEITNLSKQVSASGIRLDTQIKFLSDIEFAQYLVASDFLVCPFRQISNSGIINMAMESGIPLLLPDLPSLGWVPRAVAIWYDHKNPEPELRSAIAKAEASSLSEREAMAIAGKDFMQSRGWQNYVSEHVRVYRELVA